MTHFLSCGPFGSTNRFVGTSRTTNFDGRRGRKLAVVQSLHPRQDYGSRPIFQRIATNFLSLGMAAALFCGTPQISVAETPRDVIAIENETTAEAREAMEGRGREVGEKSNEPRSGQHVAVDNASPIIDLARIVPSSRLQGLEQQFKQLEKNTKWRLRLLSFYSNDPRAPSLDEVRKGWSVDDKTVVVLVIPDNPNIFNFRYGTEVQHFLSRPFFTELQSRYGNYFFVRDEGVEKAVDLSVATLVGCLRNPDGCAVVPGLSSEHYVATLASSVAGGLILGSVLRLDPQGFVQRRWVWALVFAPLWATLTINFGLGPVVSRTTDVIPVISNLLAATVAALAVYFYPQVAQASGLTVDYSSSDD